MARPRNGPWALLIIAVVAAAGFVRLGQWQLDRLSVRRDANRARAARLSRPVVDLSSDAVASAESLAWRRVRVHGTWDFGNQIVVRGRAFQGAPGVHVVTPLRIAPGRAVLVLRGWLPAADGVSAVLEVPDPADGRLGVIDVYGLALPGVQASPVPARMRTIDGVERLVLGALVLSDVAAAIPYELSPFYVLADSGHEATGSPRAVAVPAPTDGPHLWYAIQWFSFAAISLAGAIMYVRSRRPLDPERSRT
jgi:cytochrome oxidase assembly protein ShyY1